jgi:DNA-binding GntR family transcriptional regulator
MAGRGEAPVCPAPYGRSDCPPQRGAVKACANAYIQALTAFARRPSEEAPVASGPTFHIDRSSPTPLYFQLAQAIEAAITGGDLPAGSRLENEVLLAQRYRLARPTVRRAVAELVGKGLLVRKRGVGTQVIQPHVRRSVELTSLHDDLSRAGESPSTEVLSMNRIPAPADVARELNIAAGEEIVRVRRLRRSRGEPLALLTNYLPGRFRPAVADLTEHGLYIYLRAKAFTCEWPTSASVHALLEPRRRGSLTKPLGPPC